MKVLFEDEHYIIVNKPSGLLTHPSNECRHIKENLLFDVRDFLDGHYIYPVNRLDRGVSGIISFAKQNEGVQKFQDIWHTDKVRKHYIALAHGELEVQGIYDFPLTNHNKGVKQEALTKFKRLDLFHNSSLLEIEICTGRKHQIRRHLSRRMHAIIGDRKYGKKKWNDEYLENYQLERIFLHSSKLSFTHPYTEEIISLEENLPIELQRVIDKLHEEKERT